MNKSLTVAQQSFPKLSVMLIGLNAQYIYNSNRFSYKAAYNNTIEVQKKSAGSFLAGISANYIDVDSGKSLFNEVKRIKEYQYGFNGGYSYNWIFYKNWLLNVSASIGLSVSNYLKLRPTYLVISSCFYTSGDWCYDVTAYSNTLTIANVEKLYGVLNSGMVSVLVISGFKL